MLECDEVEEDSLSIVSNTSFVRKFVGSLITGINKGFQYLGTQSCNVPLVVDNFSTTCVQHI